MNCVSLDVEGQVDMERLQRVIVERTLSFIMSKPLAAGIDIHDEVMIALRQGMVKKVLREIEGVHAILHGKQAESPKQNNLEHNFNRV